MALIFEKVELALSAIMPDESKVKFVDAVLTSDELRNIALAWDRADEDLKHSTPIQEKDLTLLVEFLGLFFSEIRDLAYLELEKDGI